MNIWEEYEKENRIDRKRREPAEYCTVLVVNGYFPSDDRLFHKKWYWMLEGEEIFCKIITKKDEWGKYVTDFQPCRLTPSFIEEGRRIDAKDCVII